MLKSAVKGCLRRLGYVIAKADGRYAADGIFTVHQPRFRNDPAFRAAYSRGIAASAGIDPDFEWRVHVALWAAACAMRVPGDFIECGVNAGFISSAIMRYLDWAAVPRKFYLVDTFAGPDFGQYSEGEMRSGRVAVAQRALRHGAYVRDMDRVRGNFQEWPNALLVQGAVPDILSSLPVERAAFLHLDLNCAAPEGAALEHFWPRLAPGAFVLLDDYAYAGCQEQTRTLDRTAQAIGAEPVLALPTGQGLLIKSCASAGL